MAARADIILAYGAQIQELADNIIQIDRDLSQGAVARIDASVAEFGRKVVATKQQIEMSHPHISMDVHFTVNMDAANVASAIATNSTVKAANRDPQNARPTVATTKGVASAVQSSANAGPD